MTGKQLDDLCSNSSIPLEFYRIPPCLKLLLKMKANFEKLKENNQFVFSGVINDRKVYCLLVEYNPPLNIAIYHQYSSFSSMCIDMLKTVCSPTKVCSLLADYESNSTSNATMKKLSAMNKALSLIVHRIQSEFQEYADVADSFLLALLQVGNFGEIPAYVTDCKSDTNLTSIDIGRTELTYNTKSTKVEGMIELVVVRLSSGGYSCRIWQILLLSLDSIR